MCIRDRGGCVDCDWLRGQCHDANAFWAPAFFTSDGMRPFYDDAGEGVRGCALPLNFTAQVLVIGRTALLTGDNAWPPEELDRLIQWDDLSKRLSTAGVTTVVVATHWNVPGLGAVSSTETWTMYVAGKLGGFRVFGNTNHVHRNAVERSAPQVISSGQNGMRDWSSPAKFCRGSQCCPSMWASTLEWKFGGWLKGQVCGDLFGPRESADPIDSLQRKQLEMFNNGDSYAGVDDVIYTHAPPFVTDLILVGMRSSALFAMANSPIRMGYLPSCLNSGNLTAEYIMVYGISDGFPHCDNLAMMNIPFQPGCTCWTEHVHPMRSLAFPTDGLLNA